jgi:hypothetical protein
LYSSLNNNLILIFKEMKKLFFLMAVFAGILIFSACGNGTEPEPPKEEEGDKVKPEIIFTSSSLDTVLRLELGDRDGALADVKAKDDVDGDITSSVKLSGDFESIGKTRLKYTVSDKAGNVATVSRTAVITANKLVGVYEAAARLQSDTTQLAPSSITVSVKQDTILQLLRLHNLGETIEAKYAGNYTFNMVEYKNVIHQEDGRPDLTGNLSFGTKADNYKISYISYTFNFRNGRIDVWNGPCVFQY